MPDESTQSPQGTGGYAEEATSSPTENPPSTSSDRSEASITETELFDIYAQEISTFEAISSRSITIYQSQSTMGVGGILPLESRDNLGLLESDTGGQGGGSGGGTGGY